MTDLNLPSFKRRHREMAEQLWLKKDHGEGTGLKSYPIDIVDMVELLDRAHEEWVAKAKDQGITISVHQQDWIPGFAAFLDDGTPPGDANVVLNIGALVGAVASGDIAAVDLPYVVADSIMHEVMHVLEAWAGVVFDEERVEGLLVKYRDLMAKEEEEERKAVAEKPLPADLNPGIRKLVAWLRMRGFDTIDSGDGATHDHSCDRDYPYVSILVDVNGLWIAADMLKKFLEVEGVHVCPIGFDPGVVCIQATYDPSRGLGIIDLMGLADKDAPWLDDEVKGGGQ